MKPIWIFALTFFLVACDEAAVPSSTAPAASQPITLYSARAEHLIEPLLSRFTAETGIEVRFITDTEAALVARLQAEGANSPADILLTVDAGNLWHADHLGLLQPIESEVLSRNVPARYRSPQNTWFGLSLRARTIVYNPERVDATLFSDYASLADPEWKGRLCLRTSQKVYNQSLVASLIAHQGEEATETMVQGWVDNLAMDPVSGDTRALEAVAAGLCDVTLVNTYYLGRMLHDTPTAPLAVFWPNQESTGVHINVSGAGLVTHSPNPAAAIQLIEWLSSDAAQEDFAGLNFEYPVSEAVALNPGIAAWGAFRADDLNVQALGELQAQAVRLMDRAGYK